MSLNKIIAGILVLVAGAFLTSSDSIAGKPPKCEPWPECKDDGGDPPPPPDGCVDPHPGFRNGFIHTTNGTRQNASEVYFSSFNGCRSKHLGIPTNFQGLSYHTSADGAKGVIVWSENSDSTGNFIVRRMDFTVNESGELFLRPYETILPLIGEEAPPGHGLSYWYLDVWGDASHDSLYLAVTRTRSYGSDPVVTGDTRVVLVYDLNALTDVSATPDARVIYSEGAGDWQDATGLDCSSVAYPQFVPTCYKPHHLQFNPSGTRLYFEVDTNDADGENWNSVIRTHIDRSDGADPSNWAITGPEVVYAGRNWEYWPHGVQLRPDRNDPLALPTTEFIGMTYWRRRNSYPEFFHVFLDADRCASYFLAPLSGGNLHGEPDIFKSCIDNQALSTTTTNGAFQTADTILLERGNNRPDLHRRYVDGPRAGDEEFVVENSNYADTGL